MATAASEPELTVLPDTDGFEFGEQDVDETPGFQLMTLRNTGDADLYIDTVKVTGAWASRFAVVPATFNQTVEPGQSRFFAVSFVPGIPGEYTAAVRIESDDPTWPTLELPLSGTGVDQEIHVSPMAVDFEVRDVAAGASASRLVTVYNMGTTDLDLSSVSLTGANPEAFVLVSGTSGTIAAGGSRVMELAFDPVVAGAVSAKLRLESDDTTEPVVEAALSGTGVVLNPEIHVFPPFVDCGSRDVDLGPSTSRLISVQNLGTGPLSIHDVELTGAGAGDFAVSPSTYPVSVAAGGAAFLIVTFDPATLGLSEATLRITSSDADEPVTEVALRGTGTDQRVDVSRPSIAFGSRDIDLGPSPAEPLAIHNTGSATLYVASLSIVGSGASAFGLSAAGPFSIAPGKKQAVSVTFDPSAEGPVAATLRIASDDTAQPTMDVPLSGTGTRRVLTLAPTQLNFGSRDVDTGATSGSPVTLSYEGSTPLWVSAIELTGAAAGDFSVVPALNETTFQPGGVWAVNVAFDPSATGSRQATLRLTTDSVDEPTINYALTGTGIDQEIEATPGAIDIPPLLAGETVVTRDVTIRNVGMATLGLTSVVLDPGEPAAFSITDDSGETTLAPGGSRDLEVAYAPPDPGPHTGSLRILSDDTNESDITIALNGGGLAPEIDVSMAAYDFGPHAVADPSTTAALTIRNLGTVDLELASVALTTDTAPAFTILSDSGETVLGSMQTRQVAVDFHPTQPGPTSGTLRIVSNDDDEPELLIGLTGTGTAPEIEIEPAAIDFHLRAVGDPPAMERVTIRNAGTSELNLTAVALVVGSAPAYSILADTGETTLAPDGVREVTIGFQPLVFRTSNAALRVSSSDADEPHVFIPVTGQGAEKTRAGDSWQLYP